MRMPFLLGAGLAVALFVAGFGLAGRSSAVKLTARLTPPRRRRRRRQPRAGADSSPRRSRAGR